MSKVLFVDTETGGLDPLQNSLLSLGMVAWHDGNVVAEEEIYIYDPILRITPQSQKIHQIDLNELIKNGVEPVVAIQKIRDFCHKYFQEELPITLGGHNINFDIAFLKQLLGNEYRKLFSHRGLDTASLLKFMFITGKIEEDCSSSDKAFSHFNIEVGRRHTALDDARATVRLFNILVDLNRKN